MKASTGAAIPRLVEQVAMPTQAGADRPFAQAQQVRRLSDRIEARHGQPPKVIFNFDVRSGLAMAGAGYGFGGGVVAHMPTARPRNFVRP